LEEGASHSEEVPILFVLFSGIAFRSWLYWILKTNWKEGGQETGERQGEARETMCSCGAITEGLVREFEISP